MIIFLVIGLIIGAVSVVFVLQNITTITVAFFSWQLTGSLAVILLATLICGLLISALVLLPSFIKAEWQIRVYRKRIKQLEEDAAVKSEMAPRAAAPMEVVSEPTVDVDEDLRA
jgi:putative membrane protein